MVRLNHPDKISQGYIRNMMRSMSAKHICIYAALLAFIVCIEQFIRGGREWEILWLQLPYSAIFGGIYTKLYPLKDTFTKIRVGIMLTIGLLVYLYSEYIGQIPTAYLMAAMIVFFVSSRYAQYVNKKNFLLFKEHVDQKQAVKKLYAK